jgi:hypothetical protein
MSTQSSLKKLFQVTPVIVDRTGRVNALGVRTSVFGVRPHFPTEGGIRQFSFRRSPALTTFKRRNTTSANLPPSFVHHSSSAYVVNSSRGMDPSLVPDLCWRLWTQGCDILEPVAVILYLLLWLNQALNAPIEESLPRSSSTERPYRLAVR